MIKSVALMIYSFLDFELDTDKQELRKVGTVCAVEPQVFDLLRYLIENPDRLVTRDELFDKVWRGRIVSDATLSSRIKTARQAVGDNGKDQSIIQTLPRRGFRFVAELQSAQGPVAPANAASPNLSLPDKPSIAVLPFANLSNDVDQEYFSDGISEDIITALSKYRWFFVSASNSSFSYKGEAIDVQQVGRDLGVRYILEGSIRKAGDRVRVTAQLIEAETRNHIWAERYDGQLADVFDLQDEIQQAIVTAVEPELAGAELGRSKSKPPGSLDAWDLYHQGVWHVNKRNAEDHLTASDRFDQAIAIDPAFALAYAGHSWVAHSSLIYGWSQDNDAEKAKSLAFAQEAFRLDERNPFVRYRFGRALAINDDLAGAAREHRAAIDLNRNFAVCYWGLAEVLVRSRQFEEALENVEMAARLSPRDPQRFLFEMFRGRCLDGLGRLTDAEAAYRSAINLNEYPQIFWPDIWLAEFYMRENRVDDARNIISGLSQRLPGISLQKIAQLNASFDQNLASDFMENLARAGLPK